MRNIWMAFAALALLAGCAGQTLSKNQCLASDWHTLGYSDGAAGLRSTRLLEHHDACVEHGVTPERDVYMVGWNEGIREYCRAGNGFALGERGGHHANVCPDDLAYAFEEAYRDGQALFQARSTVREIERQIARHHARIDAIKDQLVVSATSQLNPALTPEERVTLIAQAAQLNEERVQLEREIPELEQDLHHAVYELEQLQATLALR